MQTDQQLRPVIGLASQAVAMRAKASALDHDGARASPLDHDGARASPLDHGFSDDLDRRQKPLVSARCTTCDAVADGVRDRGRRGKPVVIRGVTYPSLSAAARRLGLCKSTLEKAKRAGRLDQCGVGRRGVVPMPIEIRGVTYPTAKEAAAALGVKQNAVYQALMHDRLDRLGLKKPYNHARSKPFAIGGMVWPSMRSASLALGFSEDFISKALRDNDKRAWERIVAAAMRVGARKK